MSEIRIYGAFVLLSLLLLLLLLLLCLWCCVLLNYLYVVMPIAPVIFIFITDEFSSFFWPNEYGLQ